MTITVDGFGTETNKRLAHFAEAEILQGNKWPEVSKKNLKILHGIAAKNPHITFDVSHEERGKAQILLQKMESMTGKDGKYILKKTSEVHRLDSKFAVQHGGSSERK